MTEKAKTIALFLGTEKGRETARGAMAFSAIAEHAAIVLLSACAPGDYTGEEIDAILSALFLDSDDPTVKAARHALRRLEAETRFPN